MNKTLLAGIVSATFLVVAFIYLNKEKTTQAPNTNVEEAVAIESAKVETIESLEILAQEELLESETSALAKLIHAEEKKSVKASTVEDEVQTQVSAPISAPGPTTIATNIQSTNTADKVNQLSTRVVFTRITDFKEVGDKSKANQSEIELIANYSISKNQGIGIYTGADNYLTQVAGRAMKNTKLRHSITSLYTEGNFGFGMLNALILPTNEVSRKRDHLNFSIEINPNFSYKLTDKLSFYYIPRMIKNFHEYETSETNSVLPEYKIIQFYNLNYQITDKWGFSPTFIYVDTWSYLGTERDDEWGLDFLTTYEMNKRINIGLGLASSGDFARKEKGPDSTVQIYDKNSSTIYLNVGVAF